MLHVVDAYFLPFSKGLRISHSCDFMPCSPYSIGDDDQLYPLVPQIFLVVGLEIVRPLVSSMRRRRAERLFAETGQGELHEMEVRSSTAFASVFPTSWVDSRICQACILRG
jgi:hypothetical protein